MLLWSQHAFVSAMTLSLLHSLWQGAAFGLLGLALCKRLQRATPDVRCGSYSLLLAAFFVVWLGTFCCLYGKVAPSMSALPTPRAEAVLLSKTLLPSTVADTHASLALLPLLSPWLVGCWAFGVCALSLRHLGGLLLLCRLYWTQTTPCLPAWENCAARLAERMGLRRKLILRCSPQIDIPCAFGLGKSFILLPFSVLLNLPPEQVEALLAHELAHIARQDILFNLVQVCMETMLFYHPAVWWISRQIRVAREQCCDDLAVKVIGNRTLYAHALYSLEEARATIPQLALGAKGDTSKMTNGHLLHRVQRVLGVSNPEKRAPWAKGALALCTATLGLAALIPIQAYSRPLQSETKSTAAKMTKQESTTKTVTKILLNINGDEIELNTTDLKPDTLVKLNGEQGRFSDLTAQQQQELQKAVKRIPLGKSSHVLMLQGKQRGDGKFLNIFNSSQMHLILNIKGDKVELDTTDLKPSTPVTVNGEKGRFGDLSEQQQKELQQAVKNVPEPGSLHNMLVTMRKGKDGEPVRIFTSRQAHILLNINGDKVELNTTDLKPDTPVKVNGKEGRFSELTGQQQQELQKAIKGIHVLVPLKVSGSIEDAVEDLNLPDEVKVDIMEKLDEK